MMKNESKLNVSIQGERWVLFDGYWKAARGESCKYNAPTEGAVYLGCNFLPSPDMPACNEHATRENIWRKIFLFAMFDSSSPVSWSPRTTRNPAKGLERPVTMQARSISDLSCSFSQWSCLRSSRFANRQELSSSSMSEASVTFHPKVESVTYELNIEYWAEEGWMEYFACAKAVCVCVYVEADLYMWK
jgi:hypothetical protein